MTGPERLDESILNTGPVRVNRPARLPGPPGADYAIVNPLPDTPEEARMAGRRRTINRKEQRTSEYDEETEKAAAEEEDTEDEDEDEEGEEEGEEAEGEADAEAEDEADEDEGGGDEDDEDAPKKKKKKVVKPKKAAAPKRARSAKKVVRQRAVWVVFDNSSKQVETFAYNQKADAEKFLADRVEDVKKGYYIQMVKVPLDEK